MLASVNLLILSSCSTLQMIVSGDYTVFLFHQDLSKHSETPPKSGAPVVLSSHSVLETVASATNCVPFKTANNSWNSWATLTKCMPLSDRKGVQITSSCHTPVNRTQGIFYVNCSAVERDKQTCSLFHCHPESFCLKLSEVSQSTEAENDSPLSCKLTIEISSLVSNCCNERSQTSKKVANLPIQVTNLFLGRCFWHAQHRHEASF